MRYHAHYHTSGMGHVYQQRYKSFPIQDDEHFFVVCRYVERNALRAELVDRAEDWRWGSLWRWLQKPEPEPTLLSSWPLPRLPGRVARVNAPSRNKNLTPSAFQHSVESRLEMKAGLNRSPEDLTWNPRCVPGDVQEYDFPSKSQTKRPST